METPKAPDTPGDDERAAIDADAALREAEAFDPGEELAGEPAPGARRAGSPARPPSSRSPPPPRAWPASAREVVAAGYYGISGPMSAFTIAFQVPNLIRALFADAALQPAFVPVFTELIGKKHYKEAFRLASTLLLLVTMVLGAITALFVLLAPVVMPLFAPGFEGEILDLTVTLSQVLFPILVLLGISGVVVGILNSYDRFGAFAISPLFWNLTIILVLVVLEPLFHGQDRIYAYAIGDPRRHPGAAADPGLGPAQHAVPVQLSFDWRHPGVRRVLLLMLPVTISLGLINFNLLINSFFGSLVSDQAPAAIDKAFRIYQLPQGIFSVAIATVLFPTLARFANARRDRQPAGDDGQRDAPDPLRPAAGRRRDPRPLGPDDPARLPARRLRRRRRRRWSRRRSSGSPSRCRPTASTCCRRGPSSACSGPGRRPRWRRSTSSSRPLAALALYKPFGVGGIVAGDRHRHQRRGRRPGADPAPRVRRPRARPAVLDRDAGSRRLGRPGRGRLAASGTCSTRLSAAACSARSSRSAPAWRSAALVYLAVAKLLRVAELEQIMRLLRRAARCSAPGPLPAGRRRDRAPGRLRLARGGQRALAPAAAVRGRARPSGDRGPGARPPALGGGAARHASVL